MDHPENVPLREYIESILREHDRYFTAQIAALRNAVDVASETAEKVIQVQRDETNRRLAELNKLRAEVTTDRERLVTREIWDSGHRELLVWRDMVNAKLTTLETRSVTWTAAIGFAFVVLDFTIRWLAK